MGYHTQNRLNPLSDRLNQPSVDFYLYDSQDQDSRLMVAPSSRIPRLTYSRA